MIFDDEELTGQARLDRRRPRVATAPSRAANSPPDADQDRLNQHTSSARQAWRQPVLYGRIRERLADRHARRRPFEARERWFDVSLAELTAFLRDYPRVLEVRPPLDRAATYREWVDPTLGSWPQNAVAKSRTRGRRPGHQIRLS